MAGIIDTLTLDEQLQVIYIGYFGRAADGGGFNFWSGQNASAQAGGQSASQALTNIANSFAPQDETLAKYPLLGTANPDFTSPTVQLQLADFINDVYLNLFNRAADAGGLAYWQGEIISGRVGFGAAILAIANGATGDDALIINNKVDAAVDFTTDTAVAGFGFTDPLTPAFAAAAAEVLNGVTSDPATVDAAAAETDAFIASGGGSGSILNFTTGIDDLIGSANADVFNAIAGGGVGDTITPLDKANGSTGTDTLNVAVDGGSDVDLGTAAISNIERANFNVANGAGRDFFLNDAAGAFQSVAFNFNGATLTGNIDIEELSANTALSITNVDGDGYDLDVYFNETEAPISGSLLVKNVDDLNMFIDFDFDDDGSTATDTYSITFDNVQNTSGDMSLYFADIDTVNVTVATDSAIEYLGLSYYNDFDDDLPKTINLQLDANLDIGSYLDFTDATGIAVTFNVTGSGNLTVEELDDGDSDLTINASTATGNIIIDEADTDLSSLDVKYGSGNDRVSLDDGFDLTTFTADGGAGTDTLGLSVADAATASAAATFETQISNFERLLLNAVSGSNTIDLANLDDINYVQAVGSSVGGTTTIINAQSGGTYEQLNENGPFATVDIQLQTTVATNDTFNLKLSNENGGGGLFDTIKVAGVETVNITTDDVAVVPAASFSLFLDDAAATTINISGDAGLSFGASSTVLTLLDASSLTGDLSFTTGALAGPATLNGGSGDDAINAAAATSSVTINGGGGDDNLIGGAKNDTINGGADNDDITGGLGLDTLTGGAGNDVFFYAAAGGDSTGATVDIITDFTLADDFLDFGALVITYGGEVNGLAAANTALAGAANAILDTSVNQLYVDLDGSGDVNAGDTIIQLTGVLDLEQANFL